MSWLELCTSSSSRCHHHYPCSSGRTLVVLAYTRYSGEWSWNNCCCWCSCNYTKSKLQSARVVLQYFLYSTQYGHLWRGNNNLHDSPNLVCQIYEWEIFQLMLSCSNCGQASSPNDLYCVEWDVKLYYTILLYCGQAVCKNMSMKCNTNSSSNSNIIGDYPLISQTGGHSKQRNTPHLIKQKLSPV